MADYVRASGGLSRLRSLGSVVLLADNYAAVDEARGPALAGVKWVVLDRMRGAHDTEKNYHRYAPHVQLASAREEVAWMYAELQLASRCDRYTYVRGAFAAYVWEHMCHAHGGWPRFAGTKTRDS